MCQTLTTGQGLLRSVHVCSGDEDAEKEAEGGAKPGAPKDGSERVGSSSAREAFEAWQVRACAHLPHACAQARLLGAR